MNILITLVDEECHITGKQVLTTDIKIEEVVEQYKEAATTGLAEGETIKVIAAAVGFLGFKVMKDGEPQRKMFFEYQGE